MIMFISGKLQSRIIYSIIHFVALYLPVKEITYLSPPPLPLVRLPLSFQPSLLFPPPFSKLLPRPPGLPPNRRSRPGMS